MARGPPDSAHALRVSFSWLKYAASRARIDYESFLETPIPLAHCRCSERACFRIFIYALGGTISPGSHTPLFNSPLPTD